MKIQLIKEQDYPVSEWSGGITKQILLFPPTASYEQRNFAVRISTARVDLEESTFSDLTGYTRYLSLLKGTIFIKHAGHYSKQLAPFEIECFDGSWTTTAYGTCADFNLMCAQGWDGQLLAGTCNEMYTIKPHGITCVFAVDYPCLVTVFRQGNKLSDYILQPKDSLMIQNEQEELVLLLSGKHEMSETAPCALIAIARQTVDACS